MCQHIEMNYLIAYAAESIQQNIADCMQSITINGKGNIPAPAAIAMAVTSDEERKEGCAVINFGSETTTLAVFESGYLRHMAVIPFGGKHITSDLMHLNLTQEEADTLKRKFGSPIIRDTEEKLNIKGRAGSNDKHVQLKQVYSIIEARMSEIVTLCMGEIEVSGYLDKLPRWHNSHRGRHYDKGLLRLYETENGYGCPPRLAYRKPGRRVGNALLEHGVCSAHRHSDASHRALYAQHIGKTCNRQ